MQLLLSTDIDKSKVAKSRPVQVEESSTFIVNLTCLKNPDDVKKDMYGRWEHSDSHPEVFRCEFNEFDIVEIEKCAPGTTGSNVYYLRRLRSCHPTNSEFRRVIAFVHGELMLHAAASVYFSGFVSIFLCCMQSTGIQKGGYQISENLCMHITSFDIC